MEVENLGSKNFMISYCRDYPPGFGVSSSSFEGFSSGNSFHHYTRDWPPGCGPNAPKITQNFSENLSDTGKDSGLISNSSNWRRFVSAVKTKPRLRDENVMRNPQNVKGKEPVFREKEVERRSTQKLQGNLPNLDKPGERGSRERDNVMEMLNLFRKRCNEIALSGRGVRRVDTTAYGELKGEGKIVNRSALIIGSVPGIEIGDKFHYRIELVFVGLHKQVQGGIDTMEYGGGRLATCIVANERHIDKMNDPNALVYVGEGGNLKRHESGIPPDQELKSGNRALYNSMEGKKPVRVVRGLSFDRNYGQKTLYVYDGLYEVKGCVQKKGPQGNMIFEFQLIRCAGQPAVRWQDCRRSIIEDVAPKCWPSQLLLRPPSLLLIRDLDSVQRKTR